MIGVINGKPKNVGPNIDMNIVTDAGFYFISEGSSYTHAVSGSNYMNGIMEVQNFGENVIRQIYSSYYGSTYLRICWYGTWYSWMRLDNA